MTSLEFQVEFMVAMEQMPSSIETYLEDAGFTGTEILVLRRLMEGEPLTIRQLGAKTGKSTGVLDQAIKKLLKKTIVRRTVINDVPKYSLDSLRTVVEWMEDDMEQKRDMLLRRHQNFESFVSSVESGSKRPDIEYFEGENGIKQAYIKLLNGPGEILHYFPVRGKEEDDPLRDFRVQYFRERQRRKMFSRILTHDSPLGRRFQSRDVFEYRKTVLVPEAEYPFTFEKIIANDRIACIDHAAKTACVLRYPELADVEKTLFEAIWRQAQVPANTGGPQPLVTKDEPVREPIALSTVTVAQVREFFMSRKSVAAFFICAGLAAGVTYLLYWQNVSLNKLRIQERVKSIAATAALQFDAADLEQLRTAEDIHKPEYSKVLYHLNRIRRENVGVKYMYIMRPTQEKGVWQFVADADAVDPFVDRDVDGNGVIDEADHLATPGEIYDEDEGDIFNEDQYFKLDMAGAYDAATDQWGTFITGTAPIHNTSGDPVAIIGVDVEAEQLGHLVSASFRPAAYFIGFFLLFVIVRFLAFNQVAMSAYADLLRGRNAKILIAVAAAVAVACSVGIYAWSVHARIEFARNRILTIATTGALQFSFEELENLRSMQDTARPEYEGVMQKLNDIRRKNGGIKYVYLIRPQTNSTTFEFIADADAFGKDLFDPGDVSGDGLINESDEIAYPGLPYDIAHIEILRSRSYFTPAVTPLPYTDKWGAALSGYAPIRDASETVVAILAVDVTADNLYTPTIGSMIPILIFFAFLFAFTLYSNPTILRSSYLFLRSHISRKIFYGVVFAGMGVYWVMFGVHFHALRIKQEEIGRRLMAIAATAALQIDEKDLEGLRFAKDMKTEEYQRVFQKLNEIRYANPEIKWIYIYRPTSEENLWEFVVDGDSNFFLDAADDLNVDGNFTPDEENVWPGMRYYSEWPVFLEALQMPSYSKQLETDKWGTFVTAAAPIKAKLETVAILGVDVDINDLR